jgi:hypothetical protein
MLKAAV